MTDHIQKLLNFFIQERKHHAYRQDITDKFRFAVRYREAGLSDLERSVERLRDILSEEQPVVFPDEKIAFLRTVPVLPEIFTEEESAEIRKDHYIHEQGKVCNIAPEYRLLIGKGFRVAREEIRQKICELEKKPGTESRIAYEQALLDTLDTVSVFAERYRIAAEQAGNAAVADTLSRIPEEAPETFLEALQLIQFLMKLIHYLHLDQM